MNMKNSRFLGAAIVKGRYCLILLSIAALSSCASAPAPSPRTVISANAGKELAKIWAEQGATPDRIRGAFPIRFDFKRGESLPVKLFIAGGVIATPKDSPLVPLNVTRDFSMILFLNRPPRFSFDGAHWAELDAWKGALSLGLTANPQQGAALSLGLELEPRK